MALLDYERMQCGGCGGYLPETTDEDNSYVASAPGRCRRCAAKNAMQREFSDQQYPEDLMVWPVKRKLKKTE